MNKDELPKKIRDDFMGVANAEKMLIETIDKLFIDITDFVEVLTKIKKIIKQGR